eukprot:UN26370
MRGGRRPFGLTVVLVGVSNKKAQLFSCDPAGVYFQWKAVAAGKNNKELQTHLEDNYEEDMTEQQCIKAWPFKH